MNTFLNTDDFVELSKLAHTKWGLSINDSKKTIVENRLLSLFKQIDLLDVSELIKAVRLGDYPQINQALFDVLATNHTSFFRESEHFELLKNEAILPLKSTPKQTLRFWSAGCSKGCEPYTLSMLVRESLQGCPNLDARILATDLSTVALRTAKRAIYGKDVMVSTSQARIRQHFEKGHDGHSEAFRVVPEVSQLVSFAKLNLLEPWKMRGPFDAILCRNVMIYFDAETRLMIAKRMKQLLRPGGLLLLSTSESLPHQELEMECVMVGAYRNV